LSFVIGHLIPNESQLMSRLVAIEWDAKEARVVIGRKRASGVTVEQALAVPLPQREEGLATEPDVGSVLAKALADQGVARTEALVAVGRASIELRFLSTPPVPEDELPDVVRFQAVRQFTTLGDDWPLDFVPLAPNADGGMNVLAAAIAPELLEQIHKACSAAHITVSRLVLRPFAAASLIKDQLDDGQCRMIVDLLRDEADLTVLIGQQVIFPRTVRLPLTTEADVLGRTLLAEGRRTMIAAQNQLGGRRVEEVIIFGDGEHHSTLKQLLEKELSLTVRLVDPFERVEWSDPRSPRPEYPGTFAPLLGMMLDEAADVAPVIDFLHTRKKPAPPDQRRRYLYLAAAVAAVILLALGVMQWRLWSLDSEINALRITRSKQEKAAKDSVKPTKDAESLDAFAAGDIAWLDELARLSEKLPPPEAAQVAELTAQTLSKGGGGQIKFTGYVDTSLRVAELEENLRDKQHNVSGKGTDQDASRPELQWSFDELVVVTPAAATPAAAQSPATKSPAAKLPAAAAKQGGGQ
jgi:Tfp pilus assembly PilM family ATPase